MGKFPRRFITITELGVFLGISRSQCHSLVKKQPPPCFQIGIKKRLIDTYNPEFQAWLDGLLDWKGAAEVSTANRPATKPTEKPAPRIKLVS